MEKQTAVEYLIDSINKRIDLTSLKYWNEIDLMVQQAKAMEKEQIINAWIATDNELQRISAEQYYNETYNK